MSLNCKTIVAFLIIFILPYLAISQCDLSNIFGEFDIPDNRDTCLTVTFSDVLNDDLSLNTLFTGIDLEFEHDAVSDLVIDLTSPAGQTIVIVGDINASGNLTTNAQWNVIFTECSGGASPDSGISDTWDNDEPWVIGGNYTGIYYPTGGCFEDFNLGSVNGTWTLCIRDGVQFNTGHITRIGFIVDGVSSSNCNQCNPEAGSQSVDNLTVCANGDLTLDLGLNGEETDSKYETLYLVSQNGQLITITLDNNFSGLGVGQYEICAINILEEEVNDFVSSNLTYLEIVNGITQQTMPFCIDISDNCTFLEILSAPATQVLDHVICQGDNLQIGAETFTTAGTYAALLPRAGGDLCDTSVVLNLRVENVQPFIFANSTEFNCNFPTITLDALNSTQLATSDFLWTSFNGVIEGDPTQHTIEISQPGTYFLEQSKNGCVRQASLTITESVDLPNVNISSPLFTCEDDAIDISVTASSSIISAIWEGPSGFSSTVIEPSAFAAGRYNVTFTDNTGCEISAFHDVLQSSELPIVTATAPNLSCSSPIVVIEVSNTSFNNYRWTGPQGFISNIAEPEVSAPGMYFLEVQDVDGCKGYTSIEIRGDVSTFVYEVQGDDFLCDNGTTSISASAEISGAIFSWTGPNNYFSSSPNNSVTDEGTYYIEIIANGCLVRDSIEIERNVSDLPIYEPVVELLGDCENPLWRLTAVPIENEFQSSLVRWIQVGVGVVGSGKTLDVSNTGRYLLYINTYIGCIVFYDFTIDPLPSSPIVSIQNFANVTCTSGPNSGLISVVEDNNYSYSWTSSTDDTFNANTPLIDNLSPGIYDLVVTDINSGCISMLTSRIFADTLPRIVSIANTRINCNNPTSDIILTANGGGNTYSWEGPEGSFSTKDLSVTTPGTYFVTVTGGNGCITLDTTEVIEDLNPPSFNANDFVLDCLTQSTHLDVENDEAGVIYSWEGPNDFSSTTPVPVVNTSGQYSVTLTGLNGCISETNILVSENPDTPIPTLTSSDTLNCLSTSTRLNVQSDIPIVKYSWNGPGAFISQEQSPFVSEPGQYVVSVESVLGCIAYDTIEVIEEIILPDINFAFEPTIDCIDIGAQLTGVSSDPSAVFNWFGPNGFEESGASVIALDTGIYIYTVRESNNCLGSDTFNIGIADITFNDNYLSNCYEPNLSVASLSDSVSYMISWTGPNGFSSNNLSPIPPDNGVYIGTILGDNGCTATVNLNVQLDTIAPVANIQQIGTIRCEENQISLNGTGSSIGPQYGYTWSTLNGDILTGTNDFTTNIEGVGDYILIVIDSLNGCETQANMEVIEAPVEFLDMNFTTENPRCFGEDNGSVLFLEGIGGTSPYTFSLDGIFYTDDIEIGSLAPGVYTYMVKDSFGCILSRDFEIFETEALELDLGDNIDVFLGNDVEISATTNLTMDQIESIRWQIENQLGCSDCLSFSLTPDQDILIELTLMNERGCTVTDQVKVRVDQEPVLYKPNIFSPNDDGFNDVFYIFSNPGVSNIRSLQIFDRWGNRVFENSNFAPGDQSAGWDGRFQGQVLQAGVYAYKLEVEMITGQTRMQSGNVTLFK